MTQEPRAIKGDYADFKLIRTRKVCQIVVEVPMERAGDVTRLLGLPNPATGTPCAVALINETSGPCPTPGPEQRAGDRAPDAAPAPPKQVTNITRAMAMARDEQFWKFCGTYAGLKVPTNEDEALKALKLLCNVQSRTELNEFPKAAETFNRLRGKFNSWRLENFA